MLSNSNHHKQTGSSSVSNATSFLAAVFDPLGQSSGHSSTSARRRKSFSSNRSSHHALSDTIESNNNSQHVGWSSSRALDSTNHSLPDNWIDPRIAKALRSVQSSLTVILDVLQHEGVATAAVEELRMQVLHADATTTTTSTSLAATTVTCDLATILTRCQDYAAVCTSNSRSVYSKASSSSSLSATTTFQLMMACLIRASWQTVCQYQSLQYRAAYKQFHAIRQQSSASKQEIANALQQQVARAELVCAAQKGFILAAAWERKLSQTNDAATASPDGVHDATSTTTAASTPALSACVVLSTLPS